jgi:acyl carrier protein
MRDQIRSILRQHAELACDPDELADDADLYRAGLSSLATVRLMLALEDHCDIRFPDHVLGARSFATVAAIDRMISALLGDGVASTPPDAAPR